MTLDEFDCAVGLEGYLYELKGGVIEVTDVPQPPHLAQVQEARRQLVRYQDAKPGRIHTIAASHEAKLLIGPTQAERHPDLSVYLTSPPSKSADVWSIWVPAIVIEIVSPSSAKRDYEEKPADYLAFGVDEYWIIDAVMQQMTALIRWRGQWKEQVVKPSKKYTTRHLPDFGFDLKRVLAAGR